MHDVDAFTQNYTSVIWKKGEKVRERGGASYGHEGDVVDFDSGKKPAHSNTIWRVRVRYYNNLVSLAEELYAEHVNMIFHASDIWVEKIGYHSKKATSVTLATDSRIDARYRKPIHAYSRW